LSAEDLEILVSYVERARLATKPERRELKPMVNLARAARLARHEEEQELAVPEPVGEPILPELYGNHMLIPSDWRPSERTIAWTMTTLQEQGVVFDFDWIIAEFVTFWRSRAKPMANWQQAFRNNVLQKLARGLSLAPPKRNGSGPGVGPETRYTRIWDRSAELCKQRLADFDQEARDIVDRSDRDGRSPDGPVGEDD
jgi:hypothetical protein